MNESVNGMVVEEEYSIKLGSTFTNSTENNNNSLISFRYSNRPNSISTNSIGSIISNPSVPNGIYANFLASTPTNSKPLSNGSSSTSTSSTSASNSLQQDHRFSGNLIKAKEVECVLIWDDLNQCYTLEHLSNSARLTYDRLPKSGVHPQTSTSSNISPLLSTSTSSTNTNNELDSSTNSTTRGRSVTFNHKKNSLSEDVEDFGSISLNQVQDVEMSFGPLTKPSRSTSSSSSSRHSTPLPIPLSLPTPIPILAPTPPLQPYSSPIPLATKTIPSPLPISKPLPKPRATTASKGPRAATSGKKPPTTVSAARKGPAPSTSTLPPSPALIPAPANKKRRRSSIASKSLPGTSKSPAATTSTAAPQHAQKRLPAHLNNNRVRPPLPTGTQHSPGASSNSNSSDGSEEESDDDDDDDDDGDEDDDGPEGYLVPLKVAPGSVLSRSYATGQLVSGGPPMRSGKSPIKSTTIGLKSHPGNGVSHLDSDSEESESEEESEEDSDFDDLEKSITSAMNMSNNGAVGRRRSNSGTTTAAVGIGTGGKGRGGKGRGGKGQGGIPQKRPQPQSNGNSGGNNGSNGGGMSGGAMSISRMTGTGTTTLQDEASRRRAMEEADIPESSEEE